MSLFHKKHKESRSIEDILTPKREIKEVSDDIVEDEIYAEEVKNEKKNDEHIETAEDASFNALTCFGWSETKTPKWLIKCAHFWYATMSFFWFVFGACTFAPVIFISKKVQVIFKNKKKSILVGFCVYFLIISLLVVLAIVRK